MRPASPAFVRTVRGSHTMTARARVCEAFQTGTDPFGTEIPILAGDVLFDAHADVRSTLELVTDGSGTWPRPGSVLLAPYGNEVFIERGIQYGNGTTEWVSLGYFRIQTPNQASAPNGPIRVSGRDRMAGLVDGRLLTPVQFLSSRTYGSVVSQLVTQVYPSATIVWSDGGDTQSIGRDVLAEEDRYGFLNELVKGLGKIWYWDYRGFLVICNQPSTTTPLFDVDSGEGGVLVQMSRSLTRERVYNAVVASGEAADGNDPVRAVAIDNNPNSPTYYSGRFGPVPLFFSSPFLTNNGQAANAAKAILRKQLGLPYAVDFSAVPNPALEPWDPIRIRYSNRDAVETHIVERIQIPLTADGSMTGSTREQTVVLVGVL